MSSTAAAHRQTVLSAYRQLLGLLKRLPEPRRGEALGEARSTTRARQAAQDPQAVLDHMRELVAKLAYARVLAPRRPGDCVSGSFVMRDGKLVEGGGTARTARAADGSMGMDEALRRNDRDFKRLYGARKKKDIFF